MLPSAGADVFPPAQKKTTPKSHQMGKRMCWQKCDEGRNDLTMTLSKSKLFFAYNKTLENNGGPGCDQVCSPDRNGELNERTECGAAATRAHMRPGRVPQQNCSRSLPPAMLQQGKAANNCQKATPQCLVYSPLSMSGTRVFPQPNKQRRQMMLSYILAHFSFYFVSLTDESKRTMIFLQFR